MKIENHHTNGIADNASRPTAPAGEDSFRGQFKRALDASCVDAQASPVIAATRSAAALSPLPPSSFGKHAAEDGFERFIDQLATYQQRLADGRYSLKMLAQDVRRISDHCRHLEVLTRDPQVDDGLRSLLKEGLSTARIEVERFHRGDYC